MSAIGLTNPALQFFNDEGDPLAGGFLWTYESGTSTPLPTFTDSDLAPGHENTNPIELDSAGRCVMYLSPTPAMKLIVKDALGVTVYTQDEISPAAVAS